MKNDKLLTRINASDERNQKAHIKWGQPFSNDERLALLKSFLIKNNVEKKIVADILSLPDFGKKIRSEQEFSRQLIAPAVASINDDKYLQVRSLFSMILDSHKRDKNLFMLLAQKFSLMGYDSKWPDYIINSQTAVAGTLVKLVPLQDRESYQAYTKLCEDKNLSYARVSLVWGLAQFKKFVPETKQVIKELINDESVKLAALNPVDKLKIVELIPQLERLISISSDDLYVREANKTIKHLVNT